MTEINLPTKKELEASTGAKFNGTYQGGFDLAAAQKIVDDFKDLKHRDDEPVFPDVQIVKQNDGFNVVYRDVPGKVWLPTGNAILDPVINRFGRRKRVSALGYDIYDGSISTASGCDEATYRLRQYIPTSFHPIDGWADGCYREEWLSEELMAGICFCEGDVTIAVCPNVEIYKEMVKKAHQCYVGNYQGDYSHSFLPKEFEIARAAIAELPTGWRQNKLYGTDYHEFKLLKQADSAAELFEFAKEWLESSDRTINSSCRLRSARGSNMTFSLFSLERDPENVEQTIKNWNQGEENYETC
jgi:hypothetical protein